MKIEDSFVKLQDAGARITGKKMGKGQPSQKPKNAPPLQAK